MRVRGLHQAGDWAVGVGHNDAIRAGVWAACQAGLPAEPVRKEAEPLYSKLLSICSDE